MKSELLQTLELLAHLQAGPSSAGDLCGVSACSVATLKRRLADARHLGAHVESLKIGTRWVYHLANQAAVSARLARWLDLERTRSLV